MNSQKKGQSSSHNVLNMPMSDDDDDNQRGAAGGMENWVITD